MSDGLPGRPQPLPTFTEKMTQWLEDSHTVFHRKGGTGGPVCAELKSHWQTSLFLCCGLGRHILPPLIPISRSKGKKENVDLFQEDLEAPRNSQKSPGLSISTLVQRTDTAAIWTYP